MGRWGFVGSGGNPILIVELKIGIHVYLAPLILYYNSPSPFQDTGAPVPDGLEQLLPQWD